MKTEEYERNLKVSLKLGQVVSLLAEISYQLTQLRAEIREELLKEDVERQS